MSKASDFLNKTVNKLITVSQETSSEGIVYMARIKEMGLTSFGDTEQEATDKVKRMYSWCALTIFDRERVLLNAAIDQNKKKQA
jgi:phage terminase large subunit-like protein